MAGNSVGASKGNVTKKEKYGPDYHARIGAVGGRARKRGYLGKLKDEGRIEELRALQKKGAENSNRVQGKTSKRVPPKVRDNS